MHKIILTFLCLQLYNASSYALPQDFVALHDIAPDIIQDMRYAGSNNFIGEPIPGYQHAACMLTRPAAKQLKKAQKAAKAQGYSLKVYDCYRPQRSVNYFYKWSQDPSDQRQKASFYPRINKKDLFEKQYVALLSGHSRGSTVDLTLVPLGSSTQLVKPKIKRCYAHSSQYLDDNSLDMGTRFDCMDKSANLDYSHLSKNQKINRQKLQKLMHDFGFKPYPYEWWHFTLANEPYPDKYFNDPMT